MDTDYRVLWSIGLTLTVVVLASLFFIYCAFYSRKFFLCSFTDASYFCRLRNSLLISCCLVGHHAGTFGARKAPLKQEKIRLPKKISPTLLGIKTVYPLKGHSDVIKDFDIELVSAISFNVDIRY